MNQQLGHPDLLKPAERHCPSVCLFTNIWLISNFNVAAHFSLAVGKMSQTSHVLDVKNVTL